MSKIAALLINGVDRPFAPPAADLMNEFSHVTGLCLTTVGTESIQTP